MRRNAKLLARMANRRLIPKQGSEVLKIAPEPEFVVFTCRWAGSHRLVNNPK
jgi:hypothetical protein